MNALQGLTILDVGNLTAGPLTSWLLGSLGADVIKIESPGGDHGRTIFSQAEDADETGGYYYHSTNTDKRSVVLDLKSVEGQAGLLALVESADVLVENFRPGTMSSLGLNYETLREHNDALIYCSITGYGQDSYGDEERAYDSILQARSGIMTATGYAEDPPTKVGASLVDNLGSYIASLAILGALCYRERTGTGQFIDISMQDCAAWLTQFLLPFGTERTTYQPSSGPLPLNGVFEAADGWISVSALEPCVVDRLTETLGDDESDPANTEELEDLIAASVADRTVDTIVDALDDDGAVVAPIYEIEDVVADEHLEARETLQPIDCQGEEIIIPVSPYVTALESVGRPNKGGPELGEHTEEVLAELAGYDKDRIESVRQREE